MSSDSDAARRDALKLAFVAAGLAGLYLVYLAQTGGELTFPSRRPGGGSTTPISWQQPAELAVCFVLVTLLFWSVMLMLQIFFKILGSAFIALIQTLHHRWIRWAQWKPWRKWWWWPGK